MREFRGVWIATVANLDWPSSRGLSTAAQKAELTAILNRAVQAGLNAVVFQVRPASDALYASPDEPWSEYLSGTMGRAPEPFYDPLSFVIQEAHRRGLELHAWFNPYRALHRSHLGPVAENHITRKRPDLVRTMSGTDGTTRLLDPGERDVRDYCVSVILDVVKRYDVDGVQIDDYFYPATEGPFPDEASWRKYGAGGEMNREDWRRENVNAFVERLYKSIKSVKPWVKFGVSPRGIWRPGHPPQIRGSDDFLQHFADTRKWVANGWLDYFSPQLYWPIDKPEQSFPVLLKWWSEQNRFERHLWPGLAAHNAPQWSADELPNQIRITRDSSGSDGYILFRAQNVFQNSTLARAIQTLNIAPALVPASPWLGTNVPARPTLKCVATAGNIQLEWSRSRPEVVRFWLVQSRMGETWTTRILPGSAIGYRIEGMPDAVAVRGVGQTGMLGLAAVAEQYTPSRPPPPRKSIPSPKATGR